MPNNIELVVTKELVFWDHEESTTDRQFIFYAKPQESYPDRSISVFPSLIYQLDLPQVI